MVKDIAWGQAAAYVVTSISKPWGDFKGVVIKSPQSGVTMFSVRFPLRPRLRLRVHVRSNDFCSSPTLKPFQLNPRYLGQIN